MTAEEVLKVHARKGSTILGQGLKHLRIPNANRECIIKSVSKVLGQLSDSPTSYIASVTCILQRGKVNAVPQIKYAKKHLFS